MGAFARHLATGSPHHRARDGHDAGSARRRDAARLVAGALGRMVEGRGCRHRIAADGAAADGARILSADCARRWRPRRRGRQSLGRAHARLHLHRPRRRVGCRLDAFCRSADPQRLCGDRRSAPRSRRHPARFAAARLLDSRATAGEPGSFERRRARLCPHSRRVWRRPDDRRQYPWANAKSCPPPSSTMSRQCSGGRPISSPSVWSSSLSPSSCR